MLTIIGIAIAAVFVLSRWYSFHSNTKSELKSEAIDADFMKLLNQGDRHDR
ncbi:hypothetical protein [Paenibacillus rigui]|uniref:hypothetical protein n=1 Tax=Paenibacillus rigui TaxID=554312 RepID=UPI0015C65028|nr:hypothetical protein [Paenibacillus rigui]